MQDAEIINLYFSRNERAIEETIAKYEKYCFHIAYNILQDHEDAEECLNDSWNAVWKRIPPLVPVSFKTFLGEIVREEALDRYRYNHAKKRYGEMDLLMSELDECIPDEKNPEKIIEAKALDELLNHWLSEQKKETQILFVRRYYYGDSLIELSGKLGCSENRLAQKMRRIRKKLKNYLEKEGVEI